jgi:ribonucleoside-diphosphate reductase alpha chain
MVAGAVVSRGDTMLDTVAPEAFVWTASYPHPNPEIAERIYRDRYALRDEQGAFLETGWDQTVARVARAIGNGDRALEDRFGRSLERMELVPGGRVLAGAGMGTNRTLSNCFLVPIHDSRGGIIKAMGEATEILALGGGVGFDFTPLRAAGSWVAGAGGHASGPGSFITAYNAMFHTIEQGGSRRAACMGMLSADHPDIRNFVHHKAQHQNEYGGPFLADAWEHFNVSVQITDRFLSFLKAGEIEATNLWHEIAEQAWASGDPGLFFVDRANDQANSRYYQRILGTNPCGEIPLPAYGTCNLGSVNLKAFVSRGVFDWSGFEEAVKTAVLFLDNVLEVNHWPLPETEYENYRSRRLGIGCLGWADTLIEMGLRYGSPEAITMVKAVYRLIRNAGYEQSADLAAERGSFGAYDETGLFSTPFMQRLEGQEPALARRIRAKGLRNVTLMTQAPTGTISLLAGANSGIEPFFDRGYRRFDRVNNGAVVLSEYALHDSMVTSSELTAEEHLSMQAAAQKEIDQSISKTVNLPNSATVEDVLHIYELAVEYGLKGATVFRDGSRGGVLQPLTMEEVLEAASGMVCASGKCDM